MKRMDMDAKMCDLQGEPVQNADVDITLGMVVEQTLSLVDGKDAAESVKYYKLGLKVMAKDFDGELEDAEFDSVVSAVEKNPVGFLAFVHGQALEMLDGSCS